MSLPGSVRRKLSIAGVGALGVTVLSPLFCEGTVSADSTSSRPSAARKGAVVARSEPIPNPTLRESSSELRSGTSKTVRTGITGVHKAINLAFFKSNVVDRKQVVSRSGPVRRSAPPRLPASARGRYASRGGYFTGRRVLIMSASAYTAHPSENGGNASGRTAIGLKIGHGVVAVDPRVIPLGTRLYIEGYGYAVAADTGGAIKGNRIDLAMNSRSTMRAFGRRKVVVHILD